MQLSPTTGGKSEEFDIQVLVLLLSYHRCLMVVSEVLELSVEWRGVSNSLCMCVGSHGMEVVDGMHAGQSQVGWSHVRRCCITSLVRGEDTFDTRSHHLPGAQIWVELSRNWSVFLVVPEHRAPRVGSDLLSMQPVGYTQWCYTDAGVGVSPGRLGWMPA